MRPGTYHVDHACDNGRRWGVALVCLRCQSVVLDGVTLDPTAIAAAVADHDDAIHRRT